MNSPRIHATPRSIDTAQPCTFSVDGQSYQGFAGDTVTSALIAAGHIDCGSSMYHARPRGILAAGIEEPNALVTVAPRYPGDISESMLPATTVEIADGLDVSMLRGLGALDPEADTARYEHRHIHVDVLVIGAGPSGIAAAREAAKSGADTLLLDDQAAPGGQLLAESVGEAAPRLGSDGAAILIDESDPWEWAQATVARCEHNPEFRYLARTTAVGNYDSSYVVAVQDLRHRYGVESGARTDANFSGDVADTAPIVRQRVWHIRAARTVLATGAHERPIVFANNDRPGVMLAGAVRSYLNRYGVAAGQRIVIATTNDSVYALVADLHAVGLDTLAVVDSRPRLSAAAESAIQRCGVRVIAGSAVVNTAGDGVRGRISAVTVRAIDDTGALNGDSEIIAADLLAVSGGFSPVVHLHTQRQGLVAWQNDIAGFAPSTTVTGQEIVGAAAGVYSLAAALRQGALAGHRAAQHCGFSAPLMVPEAPEEAESLPRPLWLVPGEGTDPGEWRDHIVDLQRDQSVADVYRATGAGMRSIEHVKRYTSISTANDQGKTSGVNAIGVIATALQQYDLSQLGSTSHRAPYTPVAFAALAGRRRGELFDPARLTAIHPWHVARGAAFEDVGQWKRPWYYPQPGEDLDAAVLRECRAVRSSVGCMDATTLGKIEIRGADAGEFLNRVYTNGFAKLGVGKARYGVMCTADGMIFDDGVTLRLAEDRFFMTTTTGGAAKVLEWLEEWHQTEWPELDVVCTSATEQWSTIAVVGPKSRDVVAQLAPDVDLSAEAFPFMSFVETTLASGIPARICRISFSGELAFELNVDAYYGLSVWESVIAAGEPFAITPYGTETMHVLRAEKGFIIVGQDTDGTVTPQDAGMAWVVSPHKDFIGKRSFSRSDTARSDRKHLVGVLPVQHDVRLPEGAQLVAHGTPITPQHAPVPMIGHVTSSYHSAALGRTFGLAMIANGRNRIGEIVQAPLDGTLVDVEITSPVLYDPEGSRRDGEPN